MCGATRCAVALIPLALILPIERDYRDIVALTTTAVVGGSLTGSTAAIVNLLRGAPTDCRKVCYTRQQQA
jgi:hypothetical protein